MLAALFTTVLFSLSALFGNRASKILGGTETNFWRLTIATALLGLSCWLVGTTFVAQAFPIFFLSGMIGFGIGDIAFFHALPRLGSRLSVLLVHCLASPFASIVEWLWLGTTLTATQLLAATTILGGVVVALAPGAHLKIDRASLIRGVLLGTIAACSQGVGAVISRYALGLAAQVSPAPTPGFVVGMNAGFQRILGGLLVVALFLLWTKRSWIVGSRENQPAPEKGRFKRALPWVAMNALAGPTIGVACYQWALAEYPTGVVLPIVALTPLVVIPLAAWMEGERPTWRSLIGGIIAVLGAVLLQVSTRR